MLRPLKCPGLDSLPDCVKQTGNQHTRSIAVKLLFQPQFSMTGFEIFFSHSGGSPIRMFFCVNDFPRHVSFGVLAFASIVFFQTRFSIQSHASIPALVEQTFNYIYLHHKTKIARAICSGYSSAQDWIRTSTPVKALRPEHSASTNFATWAGD